MFVSKSERRFEYLHLKVHQYTANYLGFSFGLSLSKKWSRPISFFTWNSKEILYKRQTISQTKKSVCQQNYSFHFPFCCIFKQSLLSPPSGWPEWRTQVKTFPFTLSFHGLVMKSTIHKNADELKSETEIKEICK